MYLNDFLANINLIMSSKLFSDFFLFLTTKDKADSDVKQLVCIKLLNILYKRNYREM